VLCDPHPTSQTPINRQHCIATESAVAVKCGYFVLSGIKFPTFNFVRYFTLSFEEFGLRNKKRIL
jgi:hypothetical protein